ncbi:hypothetical protein Metev_1170 [Methanohalobium evestigatum Z-7303]|uniref:Uncharacterized protein n=1 Tax=Methanohalobium evestigatum (strain ATCC BAA-1072 / DSM 3721 / NBRC 107634 / OCM 161 / Z-7303) TaxID=644295 RepID=D7E9A3_METEZ|nr:DUF5320 domain-containing protein [Methanohalobium evestigatum]ADI74051.1 hypothetical protein Metev_1170 [Methanohalobium evestigatum Z-7303]
MPGGDRTGPEGKGPMTGRRLGPCLGSQTAGSMSNNSAGRGLARGRGFAFNKNGSGFGKSNFRKNSDTTKSFDDSYKDKKSIPYKYIVHRGAVNLPNALRLASASSRS